MTEELAQELKNAIAAYGLLLHAAMLGTELPDRKSTRLNSSHL